jgi:hypothetical protein
MKVKYHQKNWTSCHVNQPIELPPVDASTRSRTLAERRRFDV